MSTDAPSLPRTEVLFFDGFDDLDAIAPYELLEAAGFPITAVRPRHQAPTVHTAHGLEITVAAELGSAPELVIVPGGGWRDGRPGVRTENETGLPGQLAALHDTGTVLASVCTGAMLLAAAGVLEGRPAVTNHIAHQDLADAGADLHAQARVVDDGSVVTSGAPTAGLDLALHLIRRFGGERLADAVAEGYEYVPVGTVLVTAPASS
jgi:transcriptional regulator GlxA family with amidase domain